MTDTTPDRPSWAELLRRPGPWVQVHLDDSVDTGDPPQVLETRRKSWPWCPRRWPGSPRPAARARG
jgi:hypothetical protein